MVGHERIRQLIGRYGADTVKAAMSKQLDDAEQRLRAKLEKIEDGVWTGVSYQEQWMKDGCPARAWFPASACRPKKRPQTAGGEGSTVSTAIVAPIGQRSPIMSSVDSVGLPAEPVSARDGCPRGGLQRRSARASTRCRR